MLVRVGKNGKFLTSRITSKIDIARELATAYEIKTPINTGIMWLVYPVNSNTIIATEVDLDTAPAVAAAPIMP